MVSNISAIFLWRMRVVERNIFMDAHTFGIKMGSIRNTSCQTTRNAKCLLGMRVKRDVPQASLSFFSITQKKYFKILQRLIEDLSDVTCSKAKFTLKHGLRINK